MAAQLGRVPGEVVAVRGLALGGVVGRGGVEVGVQRHLRVDHDAATTHQAHHQVGPARTVVETHLLGEVAAVDEPGELDRAAQVQLAPAPAHLWAAQRGGKALWALPMAFVGAMIGGGLLGLAGIGLPQVELGIVLSVVALGALIALQSRLPLLASAGVVALFAVFHGQAHGAEMPEAAQPLLYGLGFALSTALLHGAGIGAALLLRRLVDGGKSALALRGTGAAVGLAGMALLALG